MLDNSTDFTINPQFFDVSSYLQPFQPFLAVLAILATFDHFLFQAIFDHLSNYILFWSRSTICRHF